MPAQSEAQRRYLYAKFGAAWVKAHHFDTKGRLPARVGRGKKKNPRASSEVKAIVKRLQGMKSSRR